MWWIILGVYVISIVLIAWSLYTAPTMPDDYDLRPEDIWPLDERPTILSKRDSKIKEEAKLYKDANKEDKKGI